MRFSLIEWLYMDEQNEANQTPQIVPAEPAVPEQAKPAISAGQSEALKAPSPETPHPVESEPSPDQTPHIVIPAVIDIEPVVAKPTEAKLPAEPVKVETSLTPQIEAPIPAPKMLTVPDTAVKARAAIQSKKRQKLERILEEVAKVGSISNNEVEKLLGVSDATASRYLVSLQKEGKLKRLGSTGKAVRYELAS